MEDDVIGKTCEFCGGPLLMGDATVQWDGRIRHMDCYRNNPPEDARTEATDAPPDAEEDLVPETCEEAVARWDAGLPVFTVEMGGLGPSYEQAIHIAAFELVRYLLYKPMPEKNAAEDEHAAFAKDLHVVLADLRMGLSSAQAGAAINVACVTKRNGWRKAVRMAPIEDRIQVQKFFPEGGR